MPSTFQPIQTVLPNQKRKQTNEEIITHYYSHSNNLIQIVGEHSNEYVRNYVQLEKFISTKFGKEVFEHFNMTMDQFIKEMIKRKTTVDKFFERVSALSDLSRFYKIDSSFISQFMNKWKIDVVKFRHDIEIVVNTADSLNIEID